MTLNKIARKQLTYPLLCTLAVIAVTSFCQWQGVLHRAELLLYDLHFSWREPQTPTRTVTLVLMDDASAEELGRQKNSWSRRQTAQALNNLCAAGATTIGIDMVFMAPSQDPDEDTILAQAVEGCNNVVLARISSSLSGDSREPLPLLQETMIGDGFIDAPLDKDGVLRRLRFLNGKPLADGSLQLFPSFALETVRVFLNLDYAFDFSKTDSFQLGTLNGRHIALPYPDLLINYRGSKETFPTISYGDVVRGNFAKEMVAGKILLLGSALATEKDRYATPLSGTSRQGETFQDTFASVSRETHDDLEFGVVCQAHGIETILTNDFIRRLSATTILLSIIILGLVGLIFYLPTLASGLEYALVLILLLTLAASSHLLFVKAAIWLEYAPLLMVVMGQFITGTILIKTMARNKAALVTSLFGKYVSGDVVQELIDGDIQTTLQGQPRELSILFSDIRAFTTIAEDLGPLGTSHLLNYFFDAMIPLVFKEKGTVDKLMGDAIMAFYGAPLAVANHQERAAESAVAMITTLERLKEIDALPGISRINIGIGLNCGIVTVGNLGCSQFMDYTIIGDPVNLASRLEGLNKVYDTKIIISQFMADHLRHKYLLRELDLVQVKGKHDPIAIYELMAPKNEANDTQVKIAQLFAQALPLYRHQKWHDAGQLFTEVLEIEKNDGPALLYRARLEEFSKEPPPLEWQGVTVFNTK
ncbi:MAG: adenylate/guanylate cyclase domain-containing protein [Proteobacteria bacterium]|nr:adenylate/guanylate cyclase domain-containing protein [Pseudomonadota bacterium]MBU1640657.1 adenylate/guanylate cyclase domain-containing protein [Pseudomonadota bacterium]